MVLMERGVELESNLAVLLLALAILVALGSVSLGVGCTPPSQPPADQESATLRAILPATEPTPDSRPSLPPVAPNASPDVILELPSGSAFRTVTLASEEACDFARAELVVEIESMPDGHITVVSPSGTEARVPLFILTTHHFFRTFGWESLRDLADPAGGPLNGPWTVNLQLRGAVYCGGSCEGGASPMPPPTLRSGELRLWCQTSAVPADSGRVLALSHAKSIDAEWHPGGSARALFVVAKACAVSEARIQLGGQVPPRALVLVDPGGTLHRLRRMRALSRAGEGVPEPMLGTAVSFSPAASSAGIWELRQPRAPRDADLSSATLELSCAVADLGVVL